MAPPDTSSSALQALLKRLWIHGFLAGVGVLFAILLICYFIWGWPFATPEGPDETQPASTQALVAPVTPPAPALETPPSASGAVEPLPASRPNSRASWPNWRKPTERKTCSNY